MRRHHRTARAGLRLTLAAAPLRNDDAVDPDSLRVADGGASKVNEPEFFLVVDFEATCSRDSVVPRDEMEIIEIGAVLQSTRTFEIEAEYQAFVRPQRHPVLTDFCRELTTITQADVDQARTFPEIVLEVQDWLCLLYTSPSPRDS